LPSEHLTLRDAGEEQVGTAVELLALSLLGRSALRRAKDVAHMRAPLFVFELDVPVPKSVTFTVCEPLSRMMSPGLMS
jgi:hypothetical protein